VEEGGVGRNLVCKYYGKKERESLSFVDDKLCLLIALATLKPQAGIMAPVGGPAAPPQPVNRRTLFHTCHAALVFASFVARCD